MNPSQHVPATRSVFGSALALALVVSASLLGVEARATSGPMQFFVSPHGSDTWSGSLSKPFRTPARAQAAVRAGTKSTRGDVVVNFRAGTYRLAQPLRLEAGDSGPKGHRVTYQPYGFGTPRAEHVALSGGRQIRGWQLTNRRLNIWTADVGALATRQLFVNGRRAPRASMQNRYNLTLIPAVGYGGASFDPISWRNPGGVEAVYTRSASNFGEPRCGVSSVLITTLVMDQPCFRRIQSNQLGVGPGMVPTSFENSLSFLRKPGTFVFDDAREGAHKLHYIPRPGERMNHTSAIAPHLERLIEAIGTSSAPVQNITFRGLTFEHTTWLYPSSVNGFAHYLSEGYEAGDTSYPASTPTARVVPGGLYFMHVQGVKLERNRFVRFGAQAVELIGSKSEIRGNEITDTSAGGILIGGAQPETHGITSSDIVIDNNWIHHAGVEYGGGTGITVYDTAHLVISHNQINDLPDRGIYFIANYNPYNDPLHTGSRIENNLIFNVMQKVSDGGGIYTLHLQGTSFDNGTLIRGNVVHDTDSVVDEVGDFRGHPLSIGLYTDYGSQWVTLDSNVVYNTLHAGGGLSAPPTGLIDNLQYLNNFWTADLYWPSAPPSNVKMSGNRMLSAEDPVRSCKALPRCRQIVANAGLRAA